MSFGENLYTTRKKNGLSQEDLAEMLGVSRQAVSKWESGEGYPEVDKLVVLSRKLNVSLDRLLDNDAAPDSVREESPAKSIRIISPNEGIIVNVSKVSRSPQFRGRKSSPKYALFTSDGNDNSLWGPQNTFLAWYRDLDDVTKEIEEIQKALAICADSYTLQYSVKCKQNLFRTIED